MTQASNCHATDYDALEASSPAMRFALRRERLVLKVTQALWEALAASGLNQAALARKLGKSESFVSQVLAGGRNLTLRTVADVATALDCDVEVSLAQEAASGPVLQFPALWRSRPEFQVQTRESFEPGGWAA